MIKWLSSGYCRSDYSGILSSLISVRSSGIMRLIQVHYYAIMLLCDVILVSVIKPITGYFISAVVVVVVVL